jgi:hypothetical protein
VRGTPQIAGRVVSMSKLLKSVGHGLMAAGAFLIVLYFVGLYVKGSDALRDAIDPLASKNYLVLLALVPGAFLLWLGDHIAARRLRLPPAGVSRPTATVHMDIQSQ